MMYGKVIDIRYNLIDCLMSIITLINLGQLSVGDNCYLFVQTRSDAGKANRAHLPYNHTSGSRSFVAAMTSMVGL